MTSTTVRAAACDGSVATARRAAVVLVVACLVILVGILWQADPSQHLTLVDALPQAQAQFINAVTIGAIYALIALGYTMVYGIIELINFAHGEIFMCGSFVSWWLLTTLGFSGAINDPLLLLGVLILAFVVAMLVMGVVGVVIERLAYRPAAQRPAPGAADHRHRRQLHPPEHRLRRGQQLHRHHAPDHPEHPARRSVRSRSASSTCS